MHIVLVAGARPNFVKIAPLIQAIRQRENLSYKLVHTGQHYDDSMSASFFRDLNIPFPDVNFECGGGTQAEQTAQIMVAFEKYLISNPADLVVVVGDVTSTMACTIVAKKNNTKVAHIEAGIRSFDTSMPEEVNRMVTDSLTDYFFTTSEYANQNLLNQGVSSKNIFFVGNVMIDTLLKNEPLFRKPAIMNTYGIQLGKYWVVTLHRPANVDDREKLKNILTEIVTHSQGIPIFFPVHPRTSGILNEMQFYSENLYLINPMGYLEFNYLVKHSMAVITDSGGITEETTVLGVPCITLRDNTERPETISMGTNELIGSSHFNIATTLQKLISGNWKKGKIPPLWDGKAAERIVEVLSRMEEQKAISRNL